MRAWERGHSVVRRFEPLWQEVGRWIFAIRREIGEGGLDYRAMSLVYTSILSLAPLLAVGFSVLKAFGVHNQLFPLLRETLAPLGEKADMVAERIISSVESIQVGVLGFLGLAMLFYTVISLIGKIEESFNHIWRARRSRSFGRRFSEYLSVILVGPVLLVSALGILGSLSDSVLAQRLISIEPLGAAYYAAAHVLPYLLLIAAFTFAYVFIPNAQVSIRPALVGGVVAGLLLKVIGSLFATFVADSAQYNAIYSGFAVFIVALIWLYLSCFTLLLGGVVSFYVQYPCYLNFKTRRPALSIRTREQVALWLMIEIGQQHRRGEPPSELHLLARRINLPWESVAEILAVLERGHLLLTLDEEASYYTLARDSEQIPLAEIFQLLRRDGENPAISGRSVESLASMRKLADGFEAALSRALPEWSLRDALVVPGGTAETADVSAGGQGGPSPDGGALSHFIR